MSPLAIIGGTGLSNLEGLRTDSRRVVPTPWGEPSAPVLFGELAGRQGVFLPRHGSGRAAVQPRPDHRLHGGPGTHVL